MQIKIKNCKKESINLDSLCELDIFDGVCKDEVCRYHEKCLYVSTQKVDVLRILDKIFRSIV